MALVLEFLDEALEESEAAGKWYADRSLSTAAGFSDEIDSAILAIQRLPEAWPPFDMALVGTCSDATRAALSTASRAVAFLSWQWHMSIADPAAGSPACDRRAKL